MRNLYEVQSCLCAREPFAQRGINCGSWDTVPWSFPRSFFFRSTDEACKGVHRAEDNAIDALG